MKAKLFILITLTFLLSSCDSKSKDAVRDYLNENRIYDYKEREWMEVDSIFFSHEISRKYDQAYNWLTGDIFVHEFNLKKLNRNKDQERIKIIQDSIALIKEKIAAATEKYDKLMSEQKYNRESISLILTYKTPLGIEKTCKYIFVFHENSLKVSHVLDEYGELVEL